MRSKRRQKIIGERSWACPVYSTKPPRICDLLHNNAFTFGDNFIQAGWSIFEANAAPCTGISQTHAPTCIFRHETSDYFGVNFMAHPRMRWKCEKSPKKKLTHNFLTTKSHLPPVTKFSPAHNAIKTSKKRDEWEKLIVPRLFNETAPYLWFTSQ